MVGEPDDRDTVVAACHGGFRPRQHDDLVPGAREGVDQTLGLDLDSPDLAEARAEEGDPHPRLRRGRMWPK